MTADDLDFDKGGGLVTVVAQDAETGAVLMVAHMDREAFNMTVATGEMHYRSRTRGPWHKGSTSGNIQRLVSLTPDCDGDAVLARVTPAGPACHNGTVSCFDQIANGDALTLLASVIESRVDGAASGAHIGAGYTQQLLRDRNLRLKKLGEETAELVLALADDDRDRAAEEGSDLLYHILVALRAQGITLNDLRHTLASRARS
jgi:phosphoribosyl-AMP cyclohydrolase / phosphoribosyl-ATP pyrophosphohydrolase